MTSITTNVKYRVRTTGLEHQGQTSISDPDQNLELTCIFSSGMQEGMFLDSVQYGNLLHVFTNANSKERFPGYIKTGDI